MASFDENGKYIKTNWKAGDKITATKLNKIEESIEAVNDNDISRHVEADARLDALEAKDVTHDKELKNVKNLIEDAKDAAELGDYEINSRMTFLEQELNEGIEEVHNVASTVDGKIATAESDMASAVAQGKADMEAMIAEADLDGLHAKDEELSEQLEHNTNKINYLNNANKYVTPEEFTGSDDEKILQCINEAISTNKTALLQNNYVLENPVYIDGVGKCLNIEVTGSIKPLTGGLYLENITDGDINIKIIDGGDEKLSSYGVRLLKCNGIKVNIKGKNYRGTLVKMGGDATNSTKVSRTQASIDSWGCLRCLEHGDETEGSYQNAFGEYVYIQDFYSTYGILFQRAYDVTINHLENMVDDTTNTISSLEFNACGSIHCNTIAVGGRCGNLFNVIDSTVCINELFVIGEDASTNPITNGLRIEGADSRVLINILSAKSVQKIVNVVNKGNNTIVNIGNIVRKSTNTTEILVEVDGFVYATPTYNTGFILNYGFVNYGNLHLYHNGTSGAMLHFKRYNTTSTAFGMGVENNTNNEFVLRSTTSDASIKYPLLARDNGDIFIGASTRSLGFYGVNKKATQQTILGAATDLDSCIALVNNIRSILINLNLVKSE